MGSMEIFHKMKIPNKIGVLLRYLIKEAVRSQPSDIFEFSAECIENLIRKEDKGLFDGTLGMDDDADFTILPAPHVISNHTEEIPMVSAIEMDELPESSAVEAWNDDAETSPFLKIEIATVNPETDVVEPLELGDLKSEEIDASHDADLANQESLLDEPSAEAYETEYHADESLNVVEETNTEDAPVEPENPPNAMEIVEEAAPAFEEVSPVEEIAAEEAQQAEGEEPLQETEEVTNEEETLPEESVEDATVEVAETASEEIGGENTDDSPNVVNVAMMEEQTEEMVLEEGEALSEAQQVEEAPSEGQLVQEELFECLEQVAEDAQETIEPLPPIEEVVEEALGDENEAAVVEAVAGEVKESAEPGEPQAVDEEAHVYNEIADGISPKMKEEEVEIFDDDTLVEDEEEIWNQLQKDIEQEEANQQELAALRIQSSYRGYRVRKSIKSEGDEDEGNDEGDRGTSEEDKEDAEKADTVPPMNEETMSRPPLSRTTSITLPEDDRLREELLSEERMDSVEIVDAYVINIQDPDESASCETKQDEEELSEPETFELHIKSNETDKDGLVEASWFEDNIKDDVYPSHYLEDIPESDEHLLAAVKIQSGYRGYRERKQLRQDRKQRAEEEKAALKIQAGYRGYATRKRITSEREVGQCEIIAPDIVTDEEEIIYGDDHAAAALAIQNSFRNKMKRRQRESMSVDSTQTECLAVPILDLDDEDLNKAALRIQSGYRGYATRKQVRKEKEAATKIQAHYRGYSIRKQARPSENYLTVPEVDQAQLDLAAAKIQATYRGHVTRKNLKNTNFPLQEAADTSDVDQEELNLAATRIQANYRGYVSRKQIKCNQNYHSPYVLPSPEVDGELNLAATKVQASYRGYATRKELKSKRNHVSLETDVKNEDYNNAAIKLQANYRGYAVRKQLKKKEFDDSQEGEEGKVHEGKFKEDDDLISAATKIQANYRGYTTRRQLDSNRQAEEEKQSELRSEEDKAAAKIQANYRGYATRKKIHKTRSNNETDRTAVYENSSNDEVSAATKIQANYRGYKTRKQLEQEKKDIGPGSDVQQEHIYGEDYENAAVKVQACYRGYSTRRKLKNEN